MTNAQHTPAPSWEAVLHTIRTSDTAPWRDTIPPRHGNESGTAFLTRLERVLARAYRTDGRGEEMGPVGALMFGMLFGDVLAKDFGFTWEPPAWTGTVGENVWDFAVCDPTRDAKVLPMRRVFKFACRDRTDGLVGMYQFVGDVRSGRVSLDAALKGEPGKWQRSGGNKFRLLPLGFKLPGDEK